MSSTTTEITSSETTAKISDGTGDGDDGADAIKLMMDGWGGACRATES